jgi:hypothetical protein
VLFLFANDASGVCLEISREMSIVRDIVGLPTGALVAFSAALSLANIAQAEKA